MFKNVRTILRKTHDQVTKTEGTLEKKWFIFPGVVENSKMSSFVTNKYNSELDMEIKNLSSDTAQESLMHASKEGRQKDVIDLIDNQNVSPDSTTDNGTT